MFDTFVIVDLEVILGRDLNEIIEIGAVKIKENAETGEIKVVDSFQSFVRPIVHKTVPKRITKLTSITTEDVKSAPCFEEVCERFKEWAGDAIFVGWGASDRGWMRQNCVTYHIWPHWFTDNYLDFQTIYHQQTKTKGNMLSLQNAVVRERLEQEAVSHRAYEDSVSCSKLFIKMYPLIQDAVFA